MTLAWLTLAAALALALGYGLYGSYSAAQPGASRGPTLDVGDPLPARIFTGAYQALAQTELLAELQSLIDSVDGIYGVAVLELDTGQSFGINQDIAFPAASTSKLAVLGQLYQELEAGSLLPTDQLAYMAGDYETGTGSLQYGEPGSLWTLEELAEKMIRESDNVAKNMLMRLLGRSTVESFAFSRGAALDLYNNKITPRSMATLLQALYRNEIAGPRLSREMFELMTDTLYETRLPRYLTGVRVAHKIGTWDNAVSDVGIVFLPDRPFVICVYSEAAGSLDESEELIGRIAARVYAYEAERQESPGAQV